MTWDDLQRIHAWESDPASYTHAPHALHTSLEQTRAAMRPWLGSWERGEIAYWVAERKDTGEPIGLGGIRATEGGINLAYRLDTAQHGQGFGSEIARAATALAAEWLPGEEVFALIRPVNVASRRTAERAGLWLTDQHPDEPDPPDGAEPSLLYLSPRVVEGCDDVTPGSAAYDEVLDLWCHVNETGGSVGFEGAAPRDEVARAFDRHLEDCRSDLGTMVRLLHPVTGAVLGAGFWAQSRHPKFHHVGELRRVMVDPRHRRRNLGRLLVGGMHAIGRDRGIEIARLNYRDGTGVQDFYVTCGYVEVGRIPGGLRLRTRDVDDVIMARRLDGHPFPAH